MLPYSACRVKQIEQSAIRSKNQNDRHVWLLINYVYLYIQPAWIVIQFFTFYITAKP